MAMIAAEVLGMAAEDVRSIVADTDSIGHTDVTGGSRITLATGMAVYEAAEDVVRQLKERAAKLWEKKPEEIEFNHGRLSAIGNGVKPMTVKEIVPKLSSAVVLWNPENKSSTRNWNELQDPALHTLAPIVRGADTSRPELTPLTLHP